LSKPSAIFQGSASVLRVRSPSGIVAVAAQGLRTRSSSAVFAPGVGLLGALTPTISNKIQTFATDFDASTSTVSNDVQFFTEQLGGVASTSNKSRLSDFSIPPGFTLGPGTDGALEDPATSSLGPGTDAAADFVPIASLGPGNDAPADFFPRFEQGTPFRFVRGAGLVARSGAPFRWVRDAGLVARPGAPFRWVRGFGLPMYGRSAPTGGVVTPGEPIQGYASPTEGRVSLTEPLNSYGGISGGESELGPARVFGAPTGGTVFFTGLVAPKLVAIGVAPWKVALTWNENYGGEIGFRIERSLNGQMMWEQIGVAAQNSFIFIDNFATPNVVFDYRIFAFNPLETSPPSNIAMASSPSPGVPAPVPAVLRQRILEFLSPGTFGVERDPDGNVGGNKF
jgi:hypothetical protein